MVADASSEDVVALDNNSLTDRLLGTDDVSEQAQHGDCATQDQQDGEEGEHQVHKNHHTVYPKGALGFRSNVWDEFFEICNLSWPVALSTLSRLAIMSTDTSFIGHLGTRELTSVSLAGAWADFCSVVVWSPAYCLNSLCSQAIGAGNKKLAGVWLQLAFFFCTVICLIVIGFYFLTETVVGMISEQPGIPHMSQQYNAFAALSLWPMVMYMALRQYFQALQIVRPAFVVSTITVFFNFAMNELLVFGIDGYGGLGLIGSPLATFCSMIFQIVSFCTYVIFIKKYHADYWDGFSLECFRADRMRRYIKVALPMTIGSAVENW
jgi:MATE family multidrug resistance protein